MSFACFAIPFSCEKLCVRQRKRRFTRRSESRSHYAIYRLMRTHVIRVRLRCSLTLRSTRRAGKARPHAGGARLGLRRRGPRLRGSAVEIEDTRRNFGESRIICYGPLSGRLVVIGYTPRAHCATSLPCERPTIVRKSVPRRTLKSDLAKVDANVIRPHEYKGLPELTEQSLSRAILNKGGGRDLRIRASLSPFACRWTSSSAGRLRGRVGKRVLPSV